tara:strand:+ start:1905 stop:2090 length:186 start_codon:yes stop_codon:yes gene_type:complete
MKKDIKIRVSEEEYTLLGTLAAQIEEQTMMRQTRTGVALACLRHGANFLLDSLEPIQQNPA